MKLSNSTLFLSILFFTSCVLSTEQQVLQDKDTGPFDAKFSQLANETLHLFKVPGIAIAVIDDGNVWAEVSSFRKSSRFLEACQQELRLIFHRATA
jgi:hypothetical protein